MMEEKQQPTGLTDDELQITGLHLQRVLEFAGKKKYEYGHFINKPMTFVREKLFYSLDSIPMQYAEALVRFVGERNFREATLAYKKRLQNIRIEAIDNPYYGQNPNLDASKPKEE